MTINNFNITFWFNIYDEHEKLIIPLKNVFHNEFQSYNIRNEKSQNLFIPIITALNPDLKANISISSINLQYNMSNVKLNDFNFFKEKVLNLYDAITEVGVQVLHTAICIDADIEVKNALNKLTKNTINKKLCNEDLIDVSLKIGQKYENLFYKIINILNKKQLKLNCVVDEKGRSLPIPLISWHDSITEKELLNFQYEINDKYSYDYNKNYHTTEFYLNKMLYLIENNLEDDINNLLEKGEF